LITKKKNIFTLNSDIRDIYNNNLQQILFNINVSENVEKSYHILIRVEKYKNKFVLIYVWFVIIHFSYKSLMINIILKKYSF
jgi:hypothetical protein